MADFYIDAGSIFENTVDPTANDDSSDGYQIGHAWVNTSTDEIFFCLDASAGAAVWVSSAVNPAAYAELYEWTSGGTDYSLAAGVWSKWTSSTEGDESASQLLSADSTNDRLDVGADGGGLYKVSGHASVKISNSSLTHIALYKNGTRVDSIRTADEKSTNQRLDLSFDGLVSLSSGDYLELYFMMDVSNPTITIYSCVLSAFRISGGGPTLGEINTGSSLGTGEGDVFKQKSGSDLEFRSLKAGTEISITQDASEVTINSTGDADAIHDNVAGEIAAITEKSSPSSADILLIEDSADSNNKKRVQITNLPSGTPVFGSQYDDSEDDTESSTTSPSYIQKLQLATGTLPAGDYRVGFQFEIKSSSSSKEIFSRVQVDDTTTMLETETVETEYIINSGFKKLTLSNATHTVDIDYYASAGATAYIRSCRIEIWRVS